MHKIILQIRQTHLHLSDQFVDSNEINVRNCLSFLLLNCYKVKFKIENMYLFMYVIAFRNRNIILKINIIYLILLNAIEIMIYVKYFDGWICFLSYFEKYQIEK